MIHVSSAMPPAWLAGSDALVAGVVPQAQLGGPVLLKQGYMQAHPATPTPILHTSLGSTSIPFSGFVGCVALSCVSDRRSVFPVRRCKFRSQAAGVKPLDTQSCLLSMHGGCRKRGCWGGTGNTSGYYRTPCSPSNPTNRRPRSMRQAPSPNSTTKPQPPRPCIAPTLAFTPDASHLIPSSRRPRPGPHPTLGGLGESG